MTQDRRRGTRDVTLRDTIDLACGVLAPSGRPPDTVRIEAEILTAHALGRTRAWILAHDRESIDPDALSRVSMLIERRAEGWPVAYLTGTREFWSRTFRVTRDVLIPRPETEHLVETALAHLPAGEPSRIADLGTGSGAIAVSIALDRPQCRVVATDLSRAALDVARANAEALGASNVEFRLGSWCGAFKDGETFDLIASNPPYVRMGDPHLDRGDLRFEPDLALAAGETGLEAIDRIAATASAHLVPNGWLVIEHGFDQAEEVIGLLRRHGYTSIGSVKDLGGHSRVAAGRRAEDAFR
jgi:release factor glutamine methyltransferase